MVTTIFELPYKNCIRPSPLPFNSASYRYIMSCGAEGQGRRADLFFYHLRTHFFCSSLTPFGHLRIRVIRVILSSASFQTICCAVRVLFFLPKSVKINDARRKHRAPKENRTTSLPSHTEPIAPLSCPKSKHYETRFCKFVFRITL